MTKLNMAVIKQKTDKKPRGKQCGACFAITYHPQIISFERFHMRDKEYRLLTGYQCKKCGHLNQI